MNGSQRVGAPYARVYVVICAYDYEGWSLPWAIVFDREAAIQLIRDAAPPEPTEEYGVYEYTIGTEEKQGEQIAGRTSHRSVWVKEQ